MFSRWIEQLDPRVRSNIEHARDWSDHEEASAPSALEISVGSSTEEPSLSSEDAWLHLQRPYRLLLEDGLTDREFLLRMCPPHERAFLRDRLDKEWLEAEHGGGVTRLPRRLRWLHERARATGLDFHASCLFDSDREAAGAPPSEEVQELAEVCREAGVHSHCLARRTIENYLPRSALEAWVLDARGRPQRNHRRRKLKALAARGREAHHFEKLKDTLGPQLGGFYADDTKINERDLDAEGGPSELRPFILELVRRVR